MTRKKRDREENRNDRVTSRLDQSESDQLERVAEETGMRKSELVREGLRLIFEKCGRKRGWLFILNRGRMVVGL